MCIKICESWLKIENEKKKDLISLQEGVKDIISNFPKDVNNFRNKQQHYDVAESYQLLERHGLVEPCEALTLTRGFEVFSEDGRKELDSVMRNLDGIAVIMCPLFHCWGR